MGDFLAAISFLGIERLAPGVDLTLPFDHQTLLELRELRVSGDEAVSPDLVPPKADRISVLALLISA